MSFMSRNRRIILVLVGLALIGISLAALTYAFAAPGILRESAPLAPTLFTLPAGSVP
jgi:hypothetical protein